VDPPKFRDGLENDEAALAEVQTRKHKLQVIIREEREKLDRRAAERRKRVEVLYTKQKLALEAGRAITRDQMVAAYQEALAIGPYEPPVPGAKGDDEEEPDDPKPKKDPDRKQPKKP